MPFIVALASVVMSIGQSDGIGMQSVGLFGKLFLPVETFEHRLVREGLFGTREWKTLEWKKNAGKERECSGKTKERKKHRKEIVGGDWNIGICNTGIPKHMTDKRHLTHNDKSL